MRCATQTDRALDARPASRIAEIAPFQGSTIVWRRPSRTTLRLVATARFRPAHGWTGGRHASTCCGRRGLEHVYRQHDVPSAMADNIESRAARTAVCRDIRSPALPRGGMILEVDCGQNRHPPRPATPDLDLIGINAHRRSVWQRHANAIAPRFDAVSQSVALFDRSDVAPAGRIGAPAYGQVTAHPDIAGIGPEAPSA